MQNTFNVFKILPKRVKKMIILLRISLRSKFLKTPRVHFLNTVNVNDLKSSRNGPFHNHVNTP